MLPKKLQDRLQRKKRIRMRVEGTSDRPRMTVHRSLTALSVQLVDDKSGKTLASANTKQLSEKGNIAGAEKLGQTIAERAKEKGIKAVVFDRNAYRYHGRIKALADAARKAGLEF